VEPVPSSGRGGPVIIDLVIFDCDGVLVNTEAVCNGVLAQVITEAGWPMQGAECSRRFQGFAMPDVWLAVEAELETKLGEEVEPDFRRRQSAALRVADLTVPGMKTLLDALPIPCCVASNGPKSKMEITLGQVGFLSRMAGNIFSRSDVRRPKPAPDLFLYAAAQMGVAPSKALVVEDSPTGILAGLAAGMTTVGFCGAGGTREGLARAHLLINRPMELLPLL
jgi:HAD superfamily hydrolase (TIGR01509 family)